MFLEYTRGCRSIRLSTKHRLSPSKFDKASNIRKVFPVSQNEFNWKLFDCQNCDNICFLKIQIFFQFTIPKRVSIDNLSTNWFIGPLPCVSVYAGWRNPIRFLLLLGRSRQASRMSNFITHKVVSVLLCLMGMCFSPVFWRPKRGKKREGWR